MVKYDSNKFWHRVMVYAAIVTVVQVFLGLMLLASAGRGPIGALYIVVMEFCNLDRQPICHQARSHSGVMRVENVLLHYGAHGKLLHVPNNTRYRRDHRSIENKTAFLETKRF